MNHWLIGGTTFRAVIAVLTMTLSAAAASAVNAQTLIEPDAKPKSSQPSGPAKPQPTVRTKSCSAFGAGFVQIPGTDTCVKVGGYLTTEGRVNHDR